MKLWQHQKQDVISNSSSSSNLLIPGRVFFDNLKEQIQKDILFLKNKLIQYNNQDLLTQLKKIRLSTGEHEIELRNKTKRNIQEKRHYIFIHIMGEVGYLLESNNNFTLFQLIRACKVLSQLDTPSGELRNPELFITKSGLVEEFVVLDSRYVRSNAEKTLSIEQLSESLILYTQH